MEKPMELQQVGRERSAALPGGRTVVTAGALVVPLGLAVVSWVVAVRQMSGMKGRNDDRSPDRNTCGVAGGPARRMGWSFPWASSSGSNFNYDFQAAHTKEEWATRS